MALFPVVGRKQPRMRIAWWSVVGILVLGILLHLFPFYFMIITTLKSGFEVLQNPPTFWPMHPTFDAWKLAFTVVSGSAFGTNNITGSGADLNYPLYFWNSIVITGLTLLISTPITAFAAYANSKLLRGHTARWMFLFFIGVIFLPTVVLLVPNYLLVQHFPFPVSYMPELPSGDPFPSITLFDTPWAMIIPAGFNAIGFLYFKAYFDTIPDSILQAARVDGGSELNIFRRIVVPMSVPVFSIVMSMQFSTTWDQFLWPSLVFATKDNDPISVAIYNVITTFQGAGTTGAAHTPTQQQLLQGLTGTAQLISQGYTWSGALVLGIIESIPIFIVFAISFKYLLQGIRIRGLK